MSPRLGCILQRFVGHAAITIALVGACSAEASASDIYFAGFAFVGEAQSIASSFPLTQQLVGDGHTPSVIDTALASRIANIRNAGFTLVTDRLGTLGPDAPSALAMSFALDRESVSVEEIGGLHKVVVDLSAEVLIFDFKEKAVIGSYPISVEFIDTLRQAPTQGDVLRIVENLYTGARGLSIFDEFAKTVSGLTLNAAPTCRWQVTEVSIDDGARSVLPEHLVTQESTLKATLAQNFSKYLSVNQHLGVLPYVTGQAIGNKMATRFADGTVFNLRVPEPDYTISLSLKPFKRLTFGTSAAGSSLVYGAFLGVAAKEPVSGATYFDATIKNGATKVVPAGQATIDEWPSYEESLLVLMDKFTKQLSTPTEDWAEKYVGRKSVAQDMDKLRCLSPHAQTKAPH